MVSGALRLTSGEWFAQPRRVFLTFFRTPGRFSLRICGTLNP